MGCFRAGVASRSNQWLSAVGPFAAAPRLNTPGTLFASVLSIAFLTKKIWRPLNVNPGVLALGVCLRQWIVCGPWMGSADCQLRKKLMTPDVSIDGY